MKKLILFLFSIVLLSSCDPNNDDVLDKGKLDPTAMILIKPAKGVKTRATVSGLTGLEVVQNAVNIKFQSHYADNTYYEDVKDIARTFIEEHKDYNKPALLMWGTDIITQEGEYLKMFTNSFNVVITDLNNDTIAYIPDAVIDAVRPLIESAFEDENYTEVYRLFNEAYTFLPMPE